MLKIIVLILLTILSTLRAAFELQQVNSEVIALGGISSFHPFGNNPGIYNSNHKIAFSTNYTNLFGIKGLHCWDFGIDYIHNQKNNVQFKANSIGDEIYQENTYSIKYARKLNIPISVGLSFSYYNLTISNFSTQNAIGLNLGVCYYINHNFQITTYYGNVNRPTMFKNKENLPEYFALGLKWGIIENFNLFKDTIYPFNSRVGLNYLLLKTVGISTGYQTNPDRISYGISLKFFNINFVYSMQNHLKLPTTYYFGCSFIIK